MKRRSDELGGGRPESAAEHGHIRPWIGGDNLAQLRDAKNFATKCEILTC